MISKRDNRKPISFDLSRIFDTLPPNSYEAECALLGSMILDGRVIGDVMEIIDSPQDMFKQAHVAVCSALFDMFDKAEPIDLVNLKNHLDLSGQLAVIGGVEGLVDLAESVPSALAASHYAKIVADHAIRRRAVDALSKSLHMAHEQREVPVEDVMDQIESEIFAVASKAMTGAANEPTTIAAEVQRMFDLLNSDDRVAGISTGFIDLDNMTSGLQPGDMIIVAARPSMGKTAFATNLAQNIAIDQQKPVAIFSLEMSRQALTERILSSRSGVDSMKIRRRMLSESNHKDLIIASKDIGDSPMLIDDTSGLTPSTLRAKARRLHSRHGLKAIMIDYIQLMHEPRHESRQVEVSSISRQIKALARELNVPIICLSQLNRMAETRADHKPQLSDLRESGSIEQDADVVMMLHRKDYYHKSDPNHQATGTTELIINKQRMGPCGVVNLQFDDKTTTFKSSALKWQGGY